MFQNQVSNPYAANAASFADADARAGFIRRTYAHLFGAVVAFVLIETLLFSMVDMDGRRQLLSTLFGTRFTWFIVLAAFMGVTYFANSLASSNASSGTQYAGLSIYVIAEALIFAPLLFLASLVSADAIPTAAVISVSTFGGLTAVVFITKSDFSGWGKYLAMAGFGLLGLILCSMFFGGGIMSLAISAFGVMLAAGYILYDTSNVVHRYRTDQHVAASLALFASVGLLFWYVLQLVLAFTGRD